jgi:hypothetical protein
MSTPDMHNETSAAIERLTDRIDVLIDRTEIAAHRADLQSSRIDMLSGRIESLRDEMRGEIAASAATLRDEIRAGFEENRIYINVRCDSLRDDIRIVAEAVASSSAKRQN